jgi:hypothetical protein
MTNQSDNFNEMIDGTEIMIIGAEAKRSDGWDVR